MVYHITKQKTINKHFLLDIIFFFLTIIEFIAVIQQLLRRLLLIRYGTINF